MRLFLFALALLVSGCSDTVTAKYSDYLSAKTNKAFVTGWVPKILPRSSRQIEESHNLDTNIGQGTFSFSTFDSKTFEKQLTPVSSNESFRGLQIESSTLEQNGYSFYKFEDFYLAINWRRSNGRFWLSHR
jgi:hypothetical protein